MRCADLSRNIVKVDVRLMFFTLRLNHDTKPVTIDRAHIRVPSIKNLLKLLEASASGRRRHRATVRPLNRLKDAFFCSMPFFNPVDLI